MLAMPETAARIGGLAARDFDIIANLETDQIELIDARDTVSVRGGPIVNHHVVVFETQNPILAEARMRRAVTWDDSRRSR